MVIRHAMRYLAGRASLGNYTYLATCFFRENQSNRSMKRFFILLLICLLLPLSVFSQGGIRLGRYEVVLLGTSTVRASELSRVLGDATGGYHNALLQLGLPGRAWCWVLTWVSMPIGLW